MSPEALAYPFIFLAIYFEVFVLVTLLSEPARAARTRAKSAATPRVSVIVPCRNEGATIAGTTESLLALDYPADKLEIVLVDNGSTDNTAEVMAGYNGHPQIQVLHVPEPGKHNAVNAGIAATTAEFVGCLDADSFVEPCALRELLTCFEDTRVAAVTAAMSIHNPRSIIEHMQNAEYSMGIAMRHALATINSLYVTPGPFSFYRRSIFTELGGFRYGHQTEDMEMALRIQQAGYKIENAPRARVYTKAPSTVPKLIRQRVRWTNGFLRNVLGEYRGMVFSRAHGFLGVAMLPMALTAVVSGVALFALALIQFSAQIAHALEVRSGVPLGYSLAPQVTGLDWFYFPTGTMLVLGVVTLLASYGLILVGRNVSQTRVHLGKSLPAYLLYSLIAPLWLVRSTVDVAFGKQRVWK